MSPRGHVDWSRWARSQVPTGRWTALPCEYSEFGDDPDLIAAVRWTLAQLSTSLQPHSSAGAGRLLIERIRGLQALIGEGVHTRPRAGILYGQLDGVAMEALEAMGWVAEERGLGGALALDGLSWDLQIADLWEVWVRVFARALAPSIGLRPPGMGEDRRALQWDGLRSMASLAPDVGLMGQERAVWIDAKYKAHLSLLARHGWPALSTAVREAHRADLHQALAYAALVDVDRVDTVLLYPHLGSFDAPSPTAVASVVAGRRRVRLVLGALPFGFRTPTHRERALDAWRSVLAA